MVAPREAVSNVDKLLASVTVTELPPAEKQLEPEDVTPPMGLMVVQCDCPRNALCDSCLAQSIAQLRGVARSRGYLWADSVARRVGTEREWPPHEGRAREIALGKVDDLGSDPRMHEALARECAADAARRWERLRRG